MVVVRSGCVYEWFWLGVVVVRQGSGLRMCHRQETELTGMRGEILIKT